jgi:hypothetical protein
MGLVLCGLGITGWFVPRLLSSRRTEAREPSVSPGDPAPAISSPQPIVTITPQPSHDKEPPLPGAEPLPLVIEDPSARQPGASGRDAAREPYAAAADPARGTENPIAPPSGQPRASRTPPLPRETRSAPAAEEPLSLRSSRTDSGESLPPVPAAVNELPRQPRMQIIEEETPTIQILE